MTSCANKRSFFSCVLQSNYLRPPRLPEYVAEQPFPHSLRVVRQSCYHLLKHDSNPFKPLPISCKQWIPRTSMALARILLKAEVSLSSGFPQLPANGNCVASTNHRGGYPYPVGYRFPRQNQDTLPAAEKHHYWFIPSPSTKEKILQAVAGLGATGAIAGTSVIIAYARREDNFKTAKRALFGGSALVLLLVVISMCVGRRPVVEIQTTALVLLSIVTLLDSGLEQL